ncbi:MAG TPA: CRISPR system precrRNA processing endoribonuclease RAMP protein Cas6 [Thermoprotei archaeon]|nr:CRISPR system precrRNA processing endoribonuclease RAMP protein Cas6 [Thermoprotei archaeon]
MIYFMNLSLIIVPFTDCILPPFTSKVTKTLFYHLFDGKSVFDRRMFSFSPLYRNGRPLYKVLKSRKDFKNISIKVSRNERLSAKISLIIKDKILLPKPEVEFKFNEYKFYAHIVNIEVDDISSISIDLPDIFRINFITPTLIPVPGRGKFLQKLGIKRRYRLFPDLSLILMLLTYDLQLQKISLTNISPVKIFKWAYKAIAELDYNIRPETILYTVKDNKPSVERGFTGYTVYQILDKKYLEEVKKLLGYGLKMGIGKSRTIGFGQITIKKEKINHLNTTNHKS